MKCIIILLPILLVSSLSPADGIEIIPEHTGIITSYPGEKVTLVFEVRNNTRETRTFESELILPPAWISPETDLPFELNAASYQIKTIGFYIPEQTPQGSFEVGYVIKDRDNGLFREKRTITVTVLPVLPVTVTTAPLPSCVFAGEEIITSFTIKNNSSRVVQIEFFLYSSQNFPLYLLNVGSTILTLPGSGSVTVDVVVETDASMTQTIKHTLELSVFSRDNPPAGLSADRPLTVETNVDVISLLPEKAVVPGHLFPVRISIRHTEQVIDRWYGDIEATISGAGSLNAEKTHHLDFRLHKMLEIPVTEQEFSSYPIIDDEDEYSLRYYSDFLDLYLGDHFYSVSPLTEQYCYGRGAAATLFFGSIGLMALFHQSLWDEPVENHTGGFITYTLKDSLYPDGYLFKADIHCFGSIGAVPGTSSDILFDYYKPDFSVGAAVEYYPLKELHLSCDLDSGGYLEDDNDWGYAWLCAGEYNGDLFLGDIIFSQTLPGFPGFYSDEISFSANGGVNLFNKSLRLSTGYMQSITHDTLGEEVITTENKRIKCGFHFNNTDTFTYIYFMWALTHSMCRSYYEELNNSFTLVVDQPVGLFALNGFAFLEIIDDAEVSGLRLKQQYTASLYYTPFEAITFGISAGFIDHNRKKSTIYVPEDEEEGVEDIDIKAGLSIRYRFDSSRSLLYTLLYNYSEDYDISIERFSKHELSFSVGYSFGLDVQTGKKTVTSPAPIQADNLSD